MSMIELKDVCYAYDDVIALRYINIKIEQGETVVIMGNNGCGKSTLLRLLNGLCYPAEGSYWFDGEQINEAFMKNSVFSRQFHQRIGYIFQNAETQLFCSSVEEEIQFGLIQMGLSDEEITRRTNDMLKLMDIEKLRDRAPYHLSGGEKRKAAIAAVLAMNPKVLVLDEPIAALDQKSQVWLTELLLQLKKAGKTMLIATHDPAFADKVADRILYMDDEHRMIEK